MFNFRLSANLMLPVPGISFAFDGTGPVSRLHAKDPTLAALDKRQNSSTLAPKINKDSFSKVSRQWDMNVPCITRFWKKITKQIFNQIMKLGQTRLKQDQIQNNFKHWVIISRTGKVLRCFLKLFENNGEILTRG